MDGIDPKPKPKTKPKTVRLSQAGFDALDALTAHMKLRLPSGIKLSEGEVVENALIEQAKLIKANGK